MVAESLAKMAVPDINGFHFVNSREFTREAKISERSPEYGNNYCPCIFRSIKTYKIISVWLNAGELNPRTKGNINVIEHGQFVITKTVFK